MSRAAAAKRVLVLTLGLIAAPSVARLSAQDGAGPRVEPSARAAQTPSSPVFRAEADVVVVDVCIKARDARSVPRLPADAFQIVDERVPQQIAFFATEDEQPLAVALLIDRSSSMAGAKLEATKTAALTFLDTLQPRDLVEVMAFNEHAARILPLSADRAEGARSIAELSTGGTTGLFQAVLVGLHDLEQAQRARATQYRNALVILSDGDDTSSLVAFDDVLEEARRSGIMIYAISLRNNDKNHWLPPPRELSQLANDTGGRAVAIGALTELASLYQEIGGELQHLYRLGFVPAPSVRDGRWHAISVRVPGQNVDIRARSGYYAHRTAPGRVP